MKKYPSRRVALTLATVLVAVALFMAVQLGRIALRPTGVYTGILLLALVLVLSLLNARKKLPFLPLLKANTWLQVHIYLGWLAVVVFLLHIRVRLPDGRLEMLLAGLFAGVTLSGIFGLWISRQLPSRLARSGESLTFEHIPAMRLRLHGEVKDLVRKAETEVKSSTLSDFYTRELNRYFLHIPALFSPLVGEDVAHHRVRREQVSLLRYLDKRETEFADQLGGFIDTKRNLDFQYAAQRLLKLWLFVHIPLTYAMLVLSMLHVWSAVKYGLRF